MQIISAPQEFHVDDLFVDLKWIVSRPLFLKCEGFNFAGSIKLKAAGEMIAAAERDGVVTAGSIIVESSSGNLGVALSAIAASRGYRFICVTDMRCNPTTIRAIVMVSVFAIFATLSLIEFKQLGLGLALAVLLDALIIRGVVLPALMTLLGRGNWWPGKLSITPTEPVEAVSSAGTDTKVGALSA
ncbi:pyridoxal-phosphate dependent enzyme [Micromonospora sp. DT233]|uniref:pyridoxal-phosphate dependent enzyme n=1 Tax=Micromonospora sp. DT233 TaxID=3393432 RepID=UPI003CEBD67C